MVDFHQTALNKVMSQFKTKLTPSELRQDGIYCLTLEAAGKRYIGSSKNIYNRINRHKSDLKRNRHGNEHLQNAFNKHGEDAFSLTILEFCPTLMLGIREQYWIDKYQTTERTFGYNKLETTDNRRNVISNETKLKISKSLMRQHYQSGQAVEMIDCKNEEVIQEFASLQAAATWIQNNTEYTGGLNVLKAKIRDVATKRKVTLRDGSKVNRFTSYGYKWRYKCLVDQEV